jgi:capsular polysaccharide biosynthesis protein
MSVFGSMAAKSDPVHDIMPFIRDIAPALSDLPLHVAVEAGDSEMDDQGLRVPGCPRYPDSASLCSSETLEPVFGQLADILGVPGRPALGLLAAAAALTRFFSTRMTFVLARSAAPDPFADWLERLSGDRALTRVMLWEGNADAPAMRLASELHNIIVAHPRFTFADTRPQRVCLFYLANIALQDPHWSWFHAERLVETIDASLLPGGLMIIAGAGRANVQQGIVGNFIKLHAGRYEIAYQGRFGVGARQAEPTLILRKLREIDPCVAPACRDASRALFVGPVTLSHELDKRFTVKPASALHFGAGIDRMTSHVVTPARTVTLRTLGDDRFRDRFPHYYVSSYRTPDIRLNRLRDGIVFSRLPTCIASGDGTIFLTSYSLADFVERGGIPAAEHRRMLEKRESGENFAAGYELSKTVLRDELAEVTNYLDQPVFYFGIRWMRMYGHFLHEACPLIGLWQQYLRPLGVKLLMHPISTAWQWDALRSLGLRDDDMLPLSPNATLMCRELWFSNSFEDSRYNMLPEITDFADRTTLSDRTRRRTLKVYAARTDTRNRPLVNEPELIERLEQIGFISVTGSEHTLAEQIAIYEQADVIVGKDGSNLSNVIFGDQKTILVEILGEDFFDPLYMRLANMRGMHYDHVLATTIRGSGREAESIVDVDLVVAAVERAMQRRRESFLIPQG